MAQQRLAFTEFFGRLAVGWAVALMVTITWAAVEVGLKIEQSRAIEAARRSTENVSLALQAHVNAVIQSIDRTLLIVRDRHKTAINSQILREFVKDSVYGDTVTEFMAFVNLEGFIVATSATREPGRLYVGDRTHIGAHLAGGPDTLFFGKPNVSRVTARWVFPITRKVFDANGKLAGVLVATLSPKRFSDIYRQFDLGANGQVALIGFDGIYRARGSKLDIGVGGALNNEAILQEAIAKGSGSLIAEASEPSLARIHGFRVAAPHPLIVDASMAVDEALVDVHALAYQARVSALVVSVIIVLLAGLVSSHRNRLAQTIEALKGSQAVAARKSSELLTALDHMNRGILMVDRDGIVRLINHRAIELLDLPARFMVDRPHFKEVVAALAEAGDFGNELASGDSALINALDLNASSTQSLVYERKRQNGRVLEVRSEPLAEGGFVRTFADITDRRRDEEANLASSRNLSRFTNVATRDLQEPMHEIYGELSRLREAMASRDVVAADRSLKRITTAAHRGQYVANDLVRYSQYCVQELHCVLVAFDLMIADAIARAQLRHGNRELSIVSTVQAMTVNCDFTYMASVFDGLIDNAVVFAVPGLPIEIRAYGNFSPQTGDFELHIRDNGRGFFVNEADRLFEPFARFGGARGQVETGISLSIAQAGVERHGWVIAANSVPDVGTTFTIVIAKRDIADAEASPTAEVVMGHNVHSLAA